jgi:hypothetical protein
MIISSSGAIERAHPPIRLSLGLAALMVFHIIICCISLVQTAHFQSDMLYDGDRLFHATIVVAAFSLVSLLFVYARFSFGYFIAFYLYTMVLGFIWLGSFTRFNYDHNLATLSAAASMLLFLLPSLLITAPVKPVFTLSARTLEHLLTAILALALVTIFTASTYNFRLVSLGHIYDFRNELHFPATIRYLIGMLSGTLLPFAFACYWTLNRRWRAGFALLLLLSFYPITLSKLTFFAAAWMLMLTALSKLFESRIATLLSLHLPILIGVILIVIFPSDVLSPRYFDTVNIRMIATPSSAMNIYNDFFASHPLTYFCQISFLKPLTNCPYQDLLSTAIERAYGLGNFNASLFATEGIASVGLLFAPLAAFACGMVMALANRLSAGLPPRFIIISGAILPQILLNVPLTTTLLTHGAAVLFLLWYVTPRTMFAPDASER